MSANKLRNYINEVVSSMDIYTIGIFIKTDKSFISKQDLGNKLRAIPSVLTIKFLDDERLDRLSASDVEYSYVMVRYLATKESPQADLQYLQNYIQHGQDDISLPAIKGILQLDVRAKTLEKQ